MKYFLYTLFISTLHSSLTYGEETEIAKKTAPDPPPIQVPNGTIGSSPRSRSAESITVIAEIPKIVLPKGTLNEYEDKGGLLKPEGVLHALRELNLIKSKGYTVKKILSGGASEAVYKITGPRGTPGFILKILRWVQNKITHRHDFSPTKELLDLSKLREHRIHRRLDRRKNPDFPKILLYTTSFSYIDKSSMKRFATIHPLAPGMDVIDQIDWNNKDNIEGKVQEMLTRVGKSVGLMHFHLATPEAQKMLDSNDTHFDHFKTLTHNDLHLGNITYDPLTTTVSLIDCSDMAESLYAPKYFMEDLYHLAYQRKYVQMTINRDPANINNALLETFVDGYVSAFSPEIQIPLREYIMKRFKSAALAFHQTAINYKSCQDMGKEYTPAKNTWMRHYVKNLKNLSNSELDDFIDYLGKDSWVLDIRG